MKTLDDILQAATYNDLFEDGTKKELRALRKLAHPDLNPHERDKAQKAFIHINKLWDMRDHPDEPAAPHSTTTPADDHLATKKNEYQNLKPLRKANGVQTYKGIDAHGNTAYLLVSTHPRISELLINGVKNLKEVKGQLTDKYREFFSDTTDAFRVAQGPHRLFGVAQTLMDPNYTLREVKEDYPEGINGRDVAWMYRRMLVAVGNLHDHGLGHGAPTLDAFLINPATHGLQLTDWQFSQPLGEDIRIVVGDVKHHYTADKTITREKDLRILSEAALRLTDAKAPRQLRTFLQGMTRYPTKTAQEALYEFDETLREVYGARKFHEFKMRRR